MDSKKTKENCNNKKQRQPITSILELLDRYFRNKASQEEVNAVENWNPEDSKEVYITNQTQIDAARNRILKGVYSYLNIQPPETINTNKVRRISLVFRRYAAIASVFILLGVGYLFYNESKVGAISGLIVAEKNSNIYESNISEIKKLTLSDGSVIHLNGGSRLRIIPDEFNKEKREVWLEEGEAFFDIAKNPLKQFIVHSGKLETIVKGTSFNIQAYQKLAGNIISVRSGIVEVKTANKNLGLYTKNKQLVYDARNEQYKSNDINWQDAAAWMEHRLVLKNATLEEFKIRIGQRYGITVQTPDKSLENILINASFKKESTLTDVLEIIHSLYGINYTIDKENSMAILSN